MKKIEVEVVGEASNAVVVQLPTRSFPGIVIQGDSLASLRSTIGRALELLKSAEYVEATEELEELAERVGSFLAFYEKALEGAGRDLPYVKR